MSFAFLLEICWSMIATEWMNSVSWLPTMASAMSVLLKWNTHSECVKTKNHCNGFCHFSGAFALKYFLKSTVVLKVRETEISFKGYDYNSLSVNILVTQTKKFTGRQKRQTRFDCHIMGLTYESKDDWQSRVHFLCRHWCEKDILPDSYYHLGV